MEIIKRTTGTMYTPKIFGRGISSVCKELKITQIQVKYVS